MACLMHSTDEDDDSSPSPAHASSTEKILDEIIEDTTAYREYIRSGGVPENNEQWTAHLAKNLAEETRRTKSPPGTPRSHELEEERALLRLTQAVVPPAHIPLDHRLADEELRRTEDQIARTLQANETLQALTNVDDDLMDDTEFDAAATRFNASVGTQESSSAAKPSVNRGEGTEEDKAKWSAFLNEGGASPALTEPVLDMTGNEDEESVFRPNFEGE